MCIHPNKRAATSHEYETDAWISIFNVTLTLPRVIKVYGYASSWATLSQLDRRSRNPFGEIIRSSWCGASVQDLFMRIATEDAILTLIGLSFAM